MAQFSKLAGSWFCRVVGIGILLFPGILRSQTPLPVENQAAVRAALPVSRPSRLLPLPAVSAHTLSGRPILLPAPHRLTLLVPSAWWAEANAVCARHAVLDCYQAARARQFAGIQTARLKHSVDDHLWDRFALLDRRRANWNRVLGKSNIACAMLLAPDGTVLWQDSGQNPDTSSQSLELVLASANY